MGAVLGTGMDMPGTAVTTETTQTLDGRGER